MNKHLKNKRLVYNIETNTPDPVCGYKWGWSTINIMAGVTNSCHRVIEDNIPENFGDFHNTPKKLETRSKMLKGAWPGQGCEYCRDIEASGGVSDRIEFNSKPGNFRYIPEEFKNPKTPNPVSVTPTILEVYFSNLCNLGCVYCHPRYSSVLFNEAKKFDDVPDTWKGGYDFQRKIDTYNDRLEEFWKWFEVNAPSLKRYNILGGEPFFQPEFYKNLEYFEKTELPELDIFIFSNMKIKKEKLRGILDRLSNITVREITIVCSIDCWGPQQEYVRTGLNMESWEENLNMMVDEYPNIKLELHGTMTSLTIKTMPELIKRWKEWDKKRPEGITISHNFCVNPSYYSPGIFPRGFFDASFNEILELLKDDYPYQHKIMKGYLKTINNTGHEKNKIKELKIQLEKNDMRRKSDYKEIFPWLAEYKKI